MKTMIYALALSAIIFLAVGCSKKEPAEQSAPAESTAAPEVASEETTPEAAPEKTPEAATAPETPAVAQPAPQEEVPVAKVGDKATALEGLTYIKGDPVTFEEGKVYVVEFWATWCSPCRVSIPHLSEVQKKFRDKGVTVIGITYEKADLDTITTFVTEQGDKMDYIVAKDTEGKVQAGYMTAYKQPGIPAAFIVDGKGAVVWVGHPMVDMEEVLTSVIDGTFDAVAYAKAQAEKAAAQQELMALLLKYQNDMASGAAIEVTRPAAEEFIEKAGAGGLVQLALNIMNQQGIDEANRDIEIATKAVMKANTETEGQDPMVLNACAVVLSKTGKLQEAITFQNKAIDLVAGNERATTFLMTQLEQFQKALDEETSEEVTGEASEETAEETSEES